VPQRTISWRKTRRARKEATHMEGDVIHRRGKGAIVTDHGKGLPLPDSRRSPGVPSREEESAWGDEG